MRVTLFLLLVTLLAPVKPAAADEADEFFELGLSYLRTAFYADARAAFAESLVRAPGQAVPTAFAGIAVAAEGRDSRSSAYLLRLAYERMPARRDLRLDLRKVMRSERDLRLIEKRFTRRMNDKKGRGSRGRGLIDNLTVLAFLQVQDGSPATSPALDQLLKARPDDSFALALKKLRAPPPKKEKPKKEKGESKKSKP